MSRIPHLVSKPVTPILQITVRIPIKSRDNLLGAFDRFAQANGFSFSLTWVEQEKGTMEARLKREELYLLLSNSFDPQEFDLDLLPGGLDVSPPADAEDLETKIRAALVSVPDLVVVKDSRLDRTPQVRPKEP